MKVWIKILLIIFLLVIISLVMIYFFVINKSHPDYDTKKPDYVLPAKTLYEQFSTDKITAGAKYNGKVIEISGIFKSIEKNDSLEVVVFSFKEGMFGDEGIRCTFLAKYTYKVLALDKKSEVRIKGFCSGFNDVDVIMEKCSLPVD
jgi:hypothetical protein